jgi:hypothetical protein
MTFNKKMPVQVKIVLVVLWLELLFGALVAVGLFRKIQVAGVRGIVELIVALIFLFTIYANYRLGAGSRWAYRYVLVATGIAVVQFIFSIALNKGISSLQVAGFAVNVGVIMLLVASASEAFYQRRT